MSRKVSNHVQNSRDWVSPVVVTPGNEVHSKFSKFSTVSWRFCTAEELNVEDIVVLDGGLTWCTHCPVSRRKCANRRQTSRLTKSKLSPPVSGLTSRPPSYLCFCCCVVYTQVELGSRIQKGRPTSLWWCVLCSWCVVPVLVTVDSEGQQRCQTDFTVMISVLCFSDVFVYMLWYLIGVRKESIWFHFGGFLYSLNSLMFLALCCVRLSLPTYESSSLMDDFRIQSRDNIRKKEQPLFCSLTVWTILDLIEEARQTIMKEKGCFLHLWRDFDFVGSMRGGQGGRCSCLLGLFTLV